KTASTKPKLPSLGGTRNASFVPCLAPSLLNQVRPTSCASTSPLTSVLTWSPSDVESTLRFGRRAWRYALTGPSSCFRVSLPGSAPTATAPIETMLRALSNVPRRPWKAGLVRSCQLWISDALTLSGRYETPRGPHVQGTEL